jgi:hypothetical protein
MIKKRSGALQGMQEIDVLLNEAVVEGVLHIPAFLFRNKNARVCQQLQVVADGWLRQVDEVFDLAAVQRVLFLPDLPDDHDPVGICQYLRYFLCLLLLHHGSRVYPELIYQSKYFDV